MLIEETLKEFPEDVAIYEINMSKIPKQEMDELKRRLETEIGRRLQELRSDKKLGLREIGYTINPTSCRSHKEEAVLRIDVKALCDDYLGLTKAVDSIFSDLTMFSKEFYQGDVITRWKDFGKKYIRNMPVEL